MCRHLGYLGPPRSVRELLHDGENSLMRQSWAPREMRGGGTINADGFGAVYRDEFAATESTPGREPELAHLRSVVGLVWRSVVLWMVLLALLTLARLLG